MELSGVDHMNIYHRDNRGQRVPGNERALKLRTTSIDPCVSVIRAGEQTWLPVSKTIVIVASLSREDNS